MGPPGIGCRGQWERGGGIVPSRTRQINALQVIQRSSAAPPPPPDEAADRPSSERTRAPSLAPSPANGPPPGLPGPEGHPPRAERAQATRVGRIARPARDIPSRPAGVVDNWTLGQEPGPPGNGFSPRIAGQDLVQETLCPVRDRGFRSPAPDRPVPHGTGHPRRRRSRHPLRLRHGLTVLSGLEEFLGKRSLAAPWGGHRPLRGARRRAAKPFRVRRSIDPSPPTCRGSAPRVIRPPVGSGRSHGKDTPSPHPVHHPDGALRDPGDLLAEGQPRPTPPFPFASPGRAW